MENLKWPSGPELNALSTQLVFHKRSPTKKTFKSHTMKIFVSDQPSYNPCAIIPQQKYHNSKLFIATPCSMCTGSLANTGVTSIICLLVKDVFLFVQATSNIYIRDYPFVKLVHKANHFFGKKEKNQKGLNNGCGLKIKCTFQ